MTVTITQDKAINIFTKAHAKRQEWRLRPEIHPEYANEKATEGDVDVLARILALRVLEIPVKTFITQGLDSDDRFKLTGIGVKALQRNTEDEDNHDVTLNLVAQKYTHYGLDYDETASQIRDLWLRLPVNPILKACVLENGIFFTMLPFMRAYGGTDLNGAALNISKDEALHVITHRTASALLGCSITEKLDYLRRQTIGWIFGNASKGVDFYLKRSDSLMKNGTTGSTEETGTYAEVCFYQLSNSSLWYK